MQGGDSAIGTDAGRQVLTAVFGLGKILATGVRRGRGQRIRIEGQFGPTALCGRAPRFRAMICQSLR